MGRKKKEESNVGNRVRFWKQIREETLQAVLAILSFLIALLSILAAFGKAGLLNNIYYVFTDLFGWGYFLIPIIFAMLGVSFLQGMEKRFKSAKSVGAIIFFISGLALINIIREGAGGMLGGLIANGLVKLADVAASSIILSALIIASVLIIFEAHITMDTLLFWRKSKEEIDLKKKKMEEDEENEANLDKVVADAEAGGSKGSMLAAAEAEAAKQRAEQLQKNSRKKEMLDGGEEMAAGMPVYANLSRSKPFSPPPLSLLERDKGKPETGDIKANANIIKRTLQNFGISVEMDEISIGPSVTRYALKPAEGVKLSRIVGLNSDLALALAAHPIRIEAPIPGKSLVGIEVPNTAKTLVGLATILSSPEYQESEKPLLASLGKDIAGKPHFANIQKAPHMLIAGATGSGKSVTIHALITSLLYRNSPENMKFIMIDPKRVELTLYNKIPHLLTPVITDPKKAILALKWAGKEMARRYDVLEKNSSRDIDSYHRNVLAPALLKVKDKKPEEIAEGEAPPETMPFIVIIIDELADIMQTYPRELEAAIVRLAQMSRAVGIHLVISTQRPSVNVITGLIKANVPTRVALQVASQVDSRTILDQMGAEKLLGAGDMLYLGGEMNKPVRLQSAYISEGEVKAVVKHIADEYKDEIMGEISLGAPEAGAGAAFDAMSDDDIGDGEDDELYEKAREVVIAAGKASTSYIQRRLGVGYSRAAKLMDILEERGVIGPANGSKPREILGGGSGSEDISAGSEVAPSEPTEVL